MLCGAEVGEMNELKASEACEMLNVNNRLNEPSAST